MTMIQTSPGAGRPRPFMRSGGLPILTPLARAIAKDVHVIFYLLTILLTLLVLAIKTWGLVALTLTALALVPVIFVLLVLITQG
jgi:hypothetical protein